MKYITSQKVLITVGTLLIAVGAVLGYGPFIRQRQEANTVGAESRLREPLTEFQAEDEEFAGKPITLSLPSLEFEGELADGEYDPGTKNWTLSKDQAHYALNTALANTTAGNTFIYGHNNKQVFSRLHDLKLGDQAIITTDNGHTFTYEYYTATVTTPWDTSLFAYEGSPILTIQTCSGGWYQNRSLFAFELVEAK